MNNSNQMPCFMNTNSKTRSLVLRIAHNIKSTENLSFSEAQKKAWIAVRLIGKLYTESENIKFSFKKVNGEIRETVGTRNDKIIPRNKHPKSLNPNEISIKAVPYFDSEKGEWRSFKPSTLLLIAS